MGFRENLQELVELVPGIEGAALMGVDGIPLEVVARDPQANLELMGAEYAVVYKDAQRAAADLERGSTRQIMVKTLKRTVFLGEVAEDYFLLVVLAPGAIGGRVRYLLAQTLPKLQMEL